MPLIDPVTMSSSSLAKAKKPAAAEKDTAATPLDPVQPYATPASTAVRHAHTALLAGSLILSFGRLVEDPSAMLTTHLFVVVLAQLAYATLCLPPGGSPAPTRKARPGEKKKTEKGGSIEVLTQSLSMHIESNGLTPSRQCRPPSSSSSSRS